MSYFDHEVHGTDRLSDFIAEGGVLDEELSFEDAEEIPLSYFDHEVHGTDRLSDFIAEGGVLDFGD